MSDLTRIENKLDKVLDRLDEHSKCLAKHEVLHQKNTDDLAEHIRRTELAEAAIVQSEKDVDERLKPIEKHVHGVGILIKALGVLITLASLIVATYKAFA